MCNACGVKIVGEKLRMADMLKKKPGEAEGFAVDFANRTQIQAGDQLAASPAPTITIFQGDNALTIGAIAVAGTQVTVRLSGGTDGAIYVLYFAVQTVGGDTLESYRTLLVSRKV